MRCTSHKYETVKLWLKSFLLKVFVISITLRLVQIKAVNYLNSKLSSSILFVFNFEICRLNKYVPIRIELIERSFNESRKMQRNIFSYRYSAAGWQMFADC